MTETLEENLVVAVWGELRDRKDLFDGVRPDVQEEIAREVVSIVLRGLANVGGIFDEMDLIDLAEGVEEL